MIKIGGNIAAQLQVKTTSKNAIGESVPKWETRHTLMGFLDLANGDSRYTTDNARMQESTHYFICDYVPLAKDILPETSRMLINGKTYDVMAIDNPMDTNYHLEIYLKYTGGHYWHAYSLSITQ